MKIGELLEALQHEPLKAVAKERLTIGEKATRKALKAAGCYSISGKKGWFYEGADTAEVLGKSIYDYVEKKEPARKPKAKAETKQRNHEPTNTQKKEPTNKDKKERLKVANKDTNKDVNIEHSNKVRKRYSFDLDTELMKNLKIQSVLEDRNIYEMVEDAIKDYLSKK
jgi:hypothetical protein